MATSFCSVSWAEDYLLLEVCATYSLKFSSFLYKGIIIDNGTPTLPYK